MHTILSIICYDLLNIYVLRYQGSRTRQTGHGQSYDIEPDDGVHMPTRPVDKERAESELSIHIKKATSPEESAPKQKHVRGA
jgi:huntingtin-interacting protein 1-related protein